MKIDLNLPNELQPEIVLDAISDRLTARFFGVVLTDRGRCEIMPFFDDIHSDDIYKAFIIALNRMDTSDNVIRYTIGILKNWRENGVDDGSLTKRVVK